MNLSENFNRTSWLRVYEGFVPMAWTIILVGILKINSKHQNSKNQTQSGKILEISEALYKCTFVTKFYFRTKKKQIIPIIMKSIPYKILQCGNKIYNIFKSNHFHIHTVKSNHFHTSSSNVTRGKHKFTNIMWVAYICLNFRKICPTSPHLPINPIMTCEHVYIF